ncbi:MAG: hypothetical protein IPM46_04105 [Flavobacteriales bacterium]|nr:hypothetical protein [Flavobacteriales bacterium]
MRLLAAASVLGLLINSPPIAAQQYGLKTLSIEEGLPSASVTALCEDGDGFLWVGTMQGAARSAGLRFEAFGRSEGLPHDQVTALHDGNGSAIWLGFVNGAVARWENGRIETIDPGQGSAVGSIVSTGESVWWATAGEGVHQWQRSQPVKRFSSADGLTANTVLALVADRHGGLIAGTDQGLFALRGERWQKVENAALPHPRVQALHADASGLLVGTAGGFAELDSLLAPLPLEQRFTGRFPIALPDPDLHAVLRARNGDLWFGTTSGLVQLTRRGGTPMLRTMREVNGLGNDLVRCLLQDRSGAIWAGTAFGGVTKYTSDAFMHFTERDGLRSRAVSAMHRTIDGRLWLGTAGGGLGCWDGRVVKAYGSGDGLTDPFILALGEDLNGFLLVGTASQGLFRQVGDRLIPVPAALGMAARRVNAIQLDAQGRCWVSCADGLMVDTGDGRFVRVPGPLQAVNSVTIEGDTLWAATSGGLLVLAIPELPWELQPMPQVPVVNLTAVARDAMGNLWIGTESQGLLRFHEGRLDSITTRNGLASNAVEQILLDAQQNIWLGTRRGVDMIELDALQEQVLGITHYGADEGFIGIECFRNASLLDSDSALWFGTVRGATRHDPRRVLEDEQEPLVHLTELRLFFEKPDWKPWCKNTDPRGIPQQLELPHDRNHLTFAFTGISLAYPEKVRYRYILEGHDPDWSPITATDRITYSNIPPGDYVFKVMARNGSGIWTSEPVTFAFIIAPPFWQTNTFRAGGGGALLIGFLGFIRLRERRLRRDRERLERTVLERTRELAHEKERSEDLLRNILPAATAEELKRKGRADARRYEQCTVLFSDFKGFTGFSSRMDSDTLVSELHHYFGLFDRLCDAHGVEKIKTIGDAYMCAAGIPTPSPTHALDALLMAFGMLDAVDCSNADRRVKGLQEWPVRIGLHCGPVVAGVVGTRKFAYDIWGDTVNLASRMEANSEAGRINISGPVYAKVMSFIEAQPRGPIKVKGKGEVQMYFALRLKPLFSADDRGWMPNDALGQFRDKLR